jgi:hypothetical protein
MKGIVGSDNIAQNEFGLPVVSPVLPPPVTPPGMVTIETTERAPVNEMPRIVDPLFEVPSLVTPTLGDKTTIKIPGFFAPDETDITAIPSLEGMEVPGLAAPELLVGPAPPDPDIPGLLS